MPIRQMLYAVLVAAIWGGNFVAAKYGIMQLPPLYITALRFAWVALLMIPFVPLPERRYYWSLFQIGSVMGVLQFSTLYASLSLGLDIPSAVIVGQMGVPFSCLLGAFFLNDKLGKWRIFGMIIAFAGMAIVAGTPSVGLHKLAFFTAMISSCFWGVGNIMVKRLSGVSQYQMLVWMSIFSVPQLLLLSWFFEANQWQLTVDAPLITWLSLFYTVFFSTVIAYNLWYHLIQHYPITQVAPFSLLTPIFGIIFGHIYFVEPMTWQIIVGGIVVLAGVGIITIRRPKLVEKGEGT